MPLLRSRLVHCVVACLVRGGKAWRDLQQGAPGLKLTTIGWKMYACWPSRSECIYIYINICVYNMYIYIYTTRFLYRHIHMSSAWGKGCGSYLTDVHTWFFGKMIPLGISSKNQTTRVVSFRLILRDLFQTPGSGTKLKCQCFLTQPYRKGSITY